MTNLEYRSAMAHLGMLARQLRLLPLREARDDLGRVETMAPMRDPTSWLTGGNERLRAQRKLLDAGLVLQDVANEMVRDAGGDALTAKEAGQ